MGRNGEHCRLHVGQYARKRILGFFFLFLQVIGKVARELDTRLLVLPCKNGQVEPGVW